jgi:dolichol kinase
MKNKLSYKNEIIRKILHLAAVLLPILFLNIESHSLFTLIVFILFTLLIFLEIIKKNKLKLWSYFTKIFSQFMRKYEHERPLGSFYMIASFLIILFIFNKKIVITSMFITIISDAMAAILGIKYGKTKTINNKSLEGSFSFLTSTIIIIFCMNFTLSYINIFLISITITFIESLTPMEYDNFTVPLFSSIILYFIL